MIRVLLVEDHASFRQAMGLALGLDPLFELAAEAGSLAEARVCLDTIDVAVIDLDLPDGIGTDLIAPLRAASPSAQVLILTASSDKGDIARAVELGAAGLLHKSAGIIDILTAIRRLGAGELLWLPGELVELMRLSGQQRMQRDVALEALSRLTPRELDVLRALGNGSSDRDIAADLSISVETVKTHMVNVLAKLGVESRLQALVFAVRHHVVQLE